MTSLTDPVAAWLRREVKARRLKPTIGDSDLVVIAGILMRAGSTNTPNKKTARASTVPATRKEARRASAQTS